MKTSSNHHGGRRPNAGRPAKYISKPSSETISAEISATRDKVKHTFYFQIKEKASKSNLIIK